MAVAQASGEDGVAALGHGRGGEDGGGVAPLGSRASSTARPLGEVAAGVRQPDEASRGRRRGAGVPPRSGRCSGKPGVGLADVADVAVAWKTPRSTALPAWTAWTPANGGGGHAGQRRARPGLQRARDGMDGRHASSVGTTMVDWDWASVAGGFFG